MLNRFKPGRTALGLALASLPGCASTDSLTAAADLEREAASLEEQADAAAEANKRCKWPSEMEKIRGRSGADPKDWLCRPARTR